MLLTHRHSGTGSPCDTLAPPAAPQSWSAASATPAAAIASSAIGQGQQQPMSSSVCIEALTSRIRNRDRPLTTATNANGGQGSRRNQDDTILALDANKANAVAREAVSMAANSVRQVRVACDELYCDPLDEAARAHVRNLLGGQAGGTTSMSPEEYCRQVRIACDDLYDEPNDATALRALRALVSVDRIAV